ncbi:MAG: hypothetical protein ACRDSL_23315 [Pseudonocardiaceae bacterium]
MDDKASFRHGDGNCRHAGSPCTADGDRLAEADKHLLEALANVVQASDQFSFGIVTSTLSITDELGFSHKLIAAAGRIRARVEKTSADHRLRTTGRWCAMTTRRKLVVKGRGPDACVIFYVEVHRRKVWITSFDCPFVSESVLEPAQADSLSDLLARAAKEAWGGTRDHTP